MKYRLAAFLIFSLASSFAATLVGCGSDSPATDASLTETGRANASSDSNSSEDAADQGQPDAAELDASDDGAVALSGEGGCTGWTTLARLSPAEVVDLMAKTDPIVINVHIPYEGDIPGTDTSIPYDDVDALDAYLHQDHCAEILLVCKSGGMSKSAGDKLIKLGYLRVRDLAGGMVAWQASGYPLLKDGGT
jgi:rhodanese-related sulfurtransferase